MWLAQRLPDPVATNSCTRQSQQVHAQSQLKNPRREQWRRYDAEGPGPTLAMTARHLMRERARNSASAPGALAFGSRDHSHRHSQVGRPRDSSCQVQGPTNRRGSGIKKKKISPRQCIPFLSTRLLLPWAALPQSPSLHLHPDTLTTQKNYRCISLPGDFITGC